MCGRRRLLCFITGFDGLLTSMPEVNLGADEVSREDATRLDRFPAINRLAAARSPDASGPSSASWRVGERIRTDDATSTPYPAGFNWFPGVERAITSSSSDISAPMSANSGVLR